MEGKTETHVQPLQTETKQVQNVSVNTPQNKPEPAQNQKPVCSVRQDVQKGFRFDVNKAVVALCEHEVSTSDYTGKYFILWKFKKNRSINTFFFRNTQKLFQTGIE